MHGKILWPGTDEGVSRSELEWYLSSGERVMNELFFRVGLTARTQRVLFPYPARTMEAIWLPTQAGPISRAQPARCPPTAKCDALRNDSLQACHTGRTPAKKKRSVGWAVTATCYYCTATWHDMRPLAGVRTLILYCILQLPVMIPTHAKVS